MKGWSCDSLFGRALMVILKASRVKPDQTQLTSMNFAKVRNSASSTISLHHSRTDFWIGKLSVKWTCRTCLFCEWACTSSQLTDSLGPEHVPLFGMRQHNAVHSVSTERVMHTWWKILLYISWVLPQNFHDFDMDRIGIFQYVCMPFHCAVSPVTKQGKTKIIKDLIAWSAFFLLMVWNSSLDKF